MYNAHFNNAYRNARTQIPGSPSSLQPIACHSIEIGFLNAVRKGESQKSQHGLCLLAFCLIFLSDVRSNATTSTNESNESVAHTKKGNKGLIAKC